MNLGYSEIIQYISRYNTLRYNDVFQDISHGLEHYFLGYCTFLKILIFQSTLIFYRYFKIFQDTLRYLKII